MNKLKRYIGFIWILLGPAAIVFLISEAAIKLNLPTATTNDFLQWGIIIMIFVPIASGLSIFGYFSVKGEYDI